MFHWPVALIFCLYINQLNIRVDYPLGRSLHYLVGRIVWRFYTPGKGTISKGLDWVIFILIHSLRLLTIFSFPFSYFAIFTFQRNQCILIYCILQTINWTTKENVYICFKVVNYAFQKRGKLWKWRDSPRIRACRMCLSQITIIMNLCYLSLLSPSVSASISSFSISISLSFLFHRHCTRAHSRSHFITLDLYLFPSFSLPSLSINT